MPLATACRRIAAHTLVAASSMTLAAQSQLTPLEEKIAESIDKHIAANQSFLEKIVNINSGTMNSAGVIAVKDQIQPRLEALGFRVQWMPMQSLTNRAGDLVAEHPCPAGEGKCGKRFL